MLLAIDSFLNRFSGLVLIFLSGILLSILAYIASIRPFWFDEVLTAHLSSLSLTELWRALRAVTDTNPPLFYLLVKILKTTIDSTELAIRIPALVGAFLFFLSIYCIVLKRSCATIALIAVLVPLTTIAPKYFIEGRPYGIVLGLAALSLLCWQHAAENHKRIIFLPGLALTLLAAISMQYYAGLIFIPIFIGELYRSARSKKIDYSILCCLFLGCLPLLFFYPLIQNLGSLLPGYWSKVNSIQSIVSSFAYIYARALIPFTVLSILVFIHYIRSMNRIRQTDAITTPHWPTHEIVAAGTYLLLPVIGVIISAAGTGIFTARYALPGILGCSIFIAYLFFRLVSPKENYVLTISFIFLLLWASFSLYQLYNTTRHAAKNRFDIAWLKQYEDFPIVFSDGLDYLPHAYYAADRLPLTPVYLYNPTAALASQGSDTNDKILYANAHFFPIAVSDPETFFAAQPEFIVIGSSGWLIPLLKKQGANLKELAAYLSLPAYQVRVSNEQQSHSQ